MNLPIVGAVDILGLERSRDPDRRRRDAAAARRPPRASRSSRSSRFARLAAREPRRLQADPGHDRLAGAGQDRRSINGTRTPLDAFAVAVAVTVSLMFVDAAARRRPARARARGARVRAGWSAGWSPAPQLLAEKIGLAALCAVAVTLLHARRPRPRSSALDWGRVAAVARRAGGRRASPSRRWAWRSAALAREVRAASLLALRALAADRLPGARPVGRGGDEPLRRRSA